MEMLAQTLGTATGTVVSCSIGPSLLENGDCNNPAAADCQ